MNKSGISAIVATVMIILATVAAVAIIWVAIVPMIQDRVVFDELSGRVSIVSSGGYTVYDAEKDVAIMQVKREVDDGVMDRIRIIFSIEGNSVSSVVVAPESGGTKTYTFDLSGYGEPDSVSVAPIFVSGSGEKREGEVSSKVGIDSVEIEDVDAIVYDLEKDYYSENLCLAILGLDVSGSVINSDSWEVGSGSAPGYTRLGSDIENEREYGRGPYEDNVLLWKAAPDDVYNADGGWNTASIPIDHTKNYRSTVWIKKTGSIDGRAYLGCKGGSTNRLDGTPNANPYFWSGDFPELDKWYLLVAYIHGSGYSSTTSYGGIYDGVTCEKVGSMVDYKNIDGATAQQQRAYLYYDLTTTDRQYFWNPTFTEVSDDEFVI